MSERAHDDLPGILALQIGVGEQRWPHTIDAAKWADEWERIFTANPSIASDWGTMLGWFANAIMAGYDTAMQRTAAERDAAIRRAEALREVLVEARQAIAPPSVRFEAGYPLPAHLRMTAERAGLLGRITAALDAARTEAK